MKKSSFMRKIAVLMMALAVVITYSVAPMNQSFAASAKKPAKVKSVKAVALSDSQTSIKVSWKKAKNAKKYQVYMATKKKGKFKKIGTTKERNYVKANLKNGKKYYFKVRAVNGKKKGAFSKVKSATAKYVAPAPGVKETPATIGESKSAILTTEIDMSKYPANQVVKVWVPVPQTDKVNGYQEISNESFIADKATVKKFTEKDGNKMLYLEWGKDVAPADRKATLSFTALRYDVSRSALKDDPKSGLSDEAKAYVSKESEFVNITDPIVKKYAAEAVKNVKDKNSTVEKTRAIYEWIINNLARIDNGEKLGNHVFMVEGCGYGNTKKILTEFGQYGIAGGHCTDLNSTFVALCRANGIAAREMFGIRLGNPGQDISTFQHCWAEFYLPGTGWVFADPADVLKAIKPDKGEEISIEEWNKAKASDLCKEKTEYFWGHVDNNRVVLSRGRDVTFEPAQAWGKCNTFGYPAAEVDGKRMPEDFTDAEGFKYTITSQNDYVRLSDEEWAKLGVESVENDDFIIDVRPNGQRESAGCVPGAAISPVGNPYTAEQKAAIKKVVDEQAGSARVVIVCVTGNNLAKNAMAALASSGTDMSRITYLKGGFNKAWSKKYPYTIGKVTVDPIEKTASINATVNEAFTTTTDGALPAVSHLVLDPEGKNGTNAPLLTDAKALDLHAALTALGAKPWSDTARTFEAGKKLSEVEGDNADFTHLDINVIKGNNCLSLSDCFNYEYKGTGDAADDPFDMAFSGNKENHTAWDTGCVSCIFSCYAGIVSNNAIGISTASASENYFTVNTEALSANDEVTLVYNLNMD